MQRFLLAVAEQAGRHPVAIALGMPVGRLVQHLAADIAHLADPANKLNLRQCLPDQGFGCSPARRGL